MYRILVLGSKVPFTSGGQDSLVKSLVRELRRRGHEADSVDVPESVSNHKDLLKLCAIWRAFSFDSFGGSKVDLVITTKFPSFYAEHSCKSLWLVHQFRTAYDLYGGNFSDFTDSYEDETIRRLITEGDTKVINECKYVSGISKNVVERLRRFNGIDADILYPPLPLEDRYRCADENKYILSVGRICGIKRIDLMIKAMPLVHHEVKLKIAGVPDEHDIMDYLKNEIAKHHIQERVEFLGRVSDEELINLYSHATLVFYAPYDEDYGYVTLEAMASGKPVLTAKDSGGVLEFVQNLSTGVVVDPEINSIAEGCNRLINDPVFREKLGGNGLKLVNDLQLKEKGWDYIIERLTSPLERIL